MGIHPPLQELFALTSEVSDPIVSIKSEDGSSTHPPRFFPIFAERSLSLLFLSSNLFECDGSASIGSQLGKVRRG
jgi:hypothetical protein